LLIGSFDAVKRGCGGAFMWFLPSLLGFSLLSKITFLGRTIKYVVIGSSLALYFIPEYIMRSSGAHLPIGIGLSLYLLPVFFIGKWIAEYLSNIDRKHDAKLFVLSASVLIGSHWILNSTRGVLELGSLDVPSIRTPVEFIVLFCGLISSYLTIDRFTRRGKVVGRGWNWLAMIGNNSLVIYLVHQLALHLVYKLFKPEVMVNYGVLINIALGFISVIAAIVFSYLFGCFLKSHIPSARFILPG
jgi:surface polysaccharide O-acyltransferase-like enzyme